MTASCDFQMKIYWFVGWFLVFRQNVDRFVCDGRKCNFAPLAFRTSRFDPHVCKVDLGGYASRIRPSQSFHWANTARRPWPVWLSRDGLGHACQVHGYHSNTFKGSFTTYLANRFTMLPALAHRTSLAVKCEKRNVCQSKWLFIDVCYSFGTFQFCDQRTELKVKMFSYGFMWLMLTSQNK